MFGSKCIEAKVTGSTKTGNVTSRINIIAQVVDDGLNSGTQGKPYRYTEISQTVEEGIQNNNLERIFHYESLRSSTMNVNYT